jgi:hypothetical protein
MLLYLDQTIVQNVGGVESTGIFSYLLILDVDINWKNMNEFHAMLFLSNLYTMYRYMQNLRNRLSRIVALRLSRLCGGTLFLVKVVIQVLWLAVRPGKFNQPGQEVLLVRAHRSESEQQRLSR